jgi:hypothetical protein
MRLFNKIFEYVRCLIYAALTFSSGWNIISKKITFNFFLGNQSTLESLLTGWSLIVFSFIYLSIPLMRKSLPSDFKTAGYIALSVIAPTAILRIIAFFMGFFGIPRIF